MTNMIARISVGTTAENDAALDALGRATGVATVS
jgi:hypothetical protein